MNKILSTVVLTSAVMLSAVYAEEQKPAAPATPVAVDPKAVEALQTILATSATNAQAAQDSDAARKAAEENAKKASDARIAAEANAGKLASENTGLKAEEEKKTAALGNMKTANDTATAELTKKLQECEARTEWTKFAPAAKATLWRTLLTAAQENKTQTAVLGGALLGSVVVLHLLVNACCAAPKVKAA